MVRIRPLLLGFAAFAILASPVQSAVTVVGGGLAQSCWKSVRTGRADRALLNVCTSALNEEALRRRDRAGTHVNRGIVHFRMRETEHALADFDRAERLNPLIGEIYVNRGAAQIVDGAFGPAITNIDRGLQLGVEESGKAYYNRALAKEALEDVRGAYFDYRKAAELDPEWALPRTQLARFSVRTVQR